MNSGFLELLKKHLVEKFHRDETLKLKNWLFVHVSNKVLVHGPNRTVTSPEILLTISSESNSKQIIIELQDKGTVPDGQIISKAISEFAPFAEIVFI